MAWEKKPIDRMEMLSLLGLLYAHTAAGYGRVGLRQLIETYGKPTVKPKRNFIIKALLSTQVLLYEGKQGKARTYKWNLKDYGAPSMLIAEMLISESERHVRTKRKDYYMRAQYQWGAKQYLASYEKGEVREYDEQEMKFPWRNLAAIASRMGKTYGMIFRFKTHKNGVRTITREF